MTTYSNAGTRTDLDVMQRIEEIVYVEGRNLSGLQIHTKLVNEPKLRGKKIPGARNIQRIVKRLRGADPSAPWSLANCDGLEGELVLGELGKLIFETKGDVTQLTVNEARWLLKVRQAAPEISSAGAFIVAKVFMFNTSQNISVLDLEQMLAFRPWQSQEACTKYWDSVDSGWVTPLQAPALRDFVADERRIRYLTSQATPTAEQSQMKSQLLEHGPEDRLINRYERKEDGRTD